MIACNGCKRGLRWFPTLKLAFYGMFNKAKHLIEKANIPSWYAQENSNPDIILRGTSFTTTTTELIAYLFSGFLPLNRDRIQA